MMVVLQFSCNFNVVVGGGEHSVYLLCHLFLFFSFFLLKEGENHQCVVGSHVPPTGGLVRNRGMCSRLGIELTTLWLAGQYT